MRKATALPHLQSPLGQLGWTLALGMALVGCRGSKPEPGAAPSAAPSPPSAGPQASASAPSSAASAVPTAPPAPNPGPAESAPDAKRYAWLNSDAGFPKPTGTLAARLATPPGYVRMPLEPGSFAAWLRDLPIAAEGTPVMTHGGEVVRAADDDYVAAVVAIDIGAQDLQQSADVVLRLQAEWLWSRGQKGAISYVSATKLDMPLSRWEKGQRLIADGPNVFWAVKTKPSELDYAEFRRFLDAVFTWANSTSLALRTKPLEDPKQLSPGDFFLHAKPPGHVAVVLDIADKPSGERVALLGQALNPAQSIHVLRPGRATPWFRMRPPQPVVTPHTAEFNWDELRRIEPANAQ
jgi:Domain of unknown function (4846)